MKRSVTFASATVALLLSLPQSASATEVGSARRFGLGFALGDPTGFVGKAWLNSENSLDFGLSFHGRCYKGSRYWQGCDGYNQLSVNIDYLWQNVLTRGSRGLRLDWHIGVGGRMWFLDNGGGGNRDLAAGVRMPVGLDLTFDNPRFLELFFELAPILYVIAPGGWWDNIEALLGVRYYF